MSDRAPESSQRPCIGCGTLNPVDAEVCTGCGYLFLGFDRASASPASPTTPSGSRRGLDPDYYTDRNPYAAPSSPIGMDPVRRSWLTVGTLLWWIGLIAVCLAISLSEPSVGITLSYFLIPSTLWTSMVAGRKRIHYLPFRIHERISTFILTVMVLFTSLVSGGPMFFISCLATGIVTNNIAIGFLSGGICAVIFSLVILSIFVRSGLRKLREEERIRYY